ncbi:uncharacterized protein L199_007457 [Kwoniella botswanensis]|uniref:uncharacterized protein n=1 Tax=Kwoniella botswanensis TaxID=1268659 RepID=UPI00315D5724
MREIYLKETDYHSNGISPRTWLDVDTLILVSHSLNCGRYGYHYLQPDLPDLKRVIWIFHPNALQDQNQVQPDEDGNWTPIEEKLMFDLSTRYPKIQITIVNVGPGRHYRLHSERDVEKTGRTHDLKAEDILRKNFPTHLGSRIDKNGEDGQKLFKFMDSGQVGRG